MLCTYCPNTGHLVERFVGDHLALCDQCETIYREGGERYARENGWVL